jgi:hypothetical protein
MEGVGQVLAMIIKDYWDVLCAIGLFFWFIGKLKNTVDFMGNRIDYEISRLREYVDIKNDNLYEKIADLKRSIEALTINISENSNKTYDELRLMNQRIDKLLNK